jgi:serine/threonine protein kinase
VRPGTTIADRFTIEGEVGSGGMGTVYRAIDRARGVPVAVKILTRYESSDVGRFLRETTLLAELSHAGIAGYVAHGALSERAPAGGTQVSAIGEQLYYVMEWIDGVTLGERVSRTGLTVAESVQVVRLVASALDHAHAHGILHRDLKPSNVMLEGGKIECARLIDFGLARRMREATKLTHTGSTIGTPGYMAPEQVRGERVLDGRADVFALGCLLYECLAGVPAFAGGNWLLVQSRILLASPPPIHGLPPELTSLLDGMLAKQSGARTPDCGAVLAALDALPPLAPSPRRSPRGLHFDRTERALPAWRFPADAACFVVSVLEDLPEAFEQIVREFAAEVSRLKDGALVIRVAAAARAEGCAKALRSLAPHAPIAIARSPAMLEEATREVIAADLAVLFGHGVPPIRVL